MITALIGSTFHIVANGDRWTRKTYDCPGCDGSGLEGMEDCSFCGGLGVLDVPPGEAMDQ